MQLIINSGKAKGKLIKVTGPRVLIGRGSECQLRPLSEEVSTLHAELKIQTDAATIRDLGSASGTRVNGEKLLGAATLRNGDRIEIGPLSLTALLDIAEQAKRKRRTIEDGVASWLIDEGSQADKDAAPARVHHARGIPASEASPGREGASRSAAAPRPPVCGGEADFALLKSMTTRSD